METRTNEDLLCLNVFRRHRGFPRSPAAPADITIPQYVCYKENETTNGRAVLQSWYLRAAGPFSLRRIWNKTVALARGNNGKDKRRRGRKRNRKKERKKMEKGQKGSGEQAVLQISRLKSGRKHATMRRYAKWRWLYAKGLLPPIHFPSLLSFRVYDSRDAFFIYFTRFVYKWNVNAAKFTSSFPPVPLEQ